MASRLLVSTRRARRYATPAISPSSPPLLSVRPPPSGSSIVDHRFIPFTSSDNQNYSKISRRWHVGHSHGDCSAGSSDGVFRLGLASDVALAVGKTITGYASGSTAIIADAVHSISDIILSGVAWLSYRVGSAPKDKEHPYGHGKFETLGALGISCMLVATAGGIAWHAVDVLQGVLTSNSHLTSHLMLHEHSNNDRHGDHHHGIDMDHPVLALNMTIISIGVKEWFYWITRKAGEREGSGLMKANAWHHREDAISSVVALIGVGGSILGARFLDPLAGLVVSGMILKAGVASGYQSVMELVDAAVPSHILEPMRNTILQVRGVMGCHRLRGRKAGSCLYLDVHIEVDPFLSVSAGHDIGEHVRNQLQRSHSEIAEVFIHIDPSASQVSDAISNSQQNITEKHKETIPFSSEESIVGLVDDLLSERYSKKMTVEHVMYHSLQGKLLVQVQVSMLPNMLIREAIEIAKEAEAKIMEAAPSVEQVSLQLALGDPIPRIHGEPFGKRNTKVNK